METKMDADLRARWDRFLAGHWTKTKPTEPGVYRTADYEGNQSSAPVIVVRLTDGTLHYLSTWGAYWWSEPTPELPPCVCG